MAIGIELILIGFGVFIGGMVIFTLSYVYNMLMKRRWSVVVPILVQRGETGIQWLFDRARYVKTDVGKEYLRLKKEKKKIKAPKFGYVYTTKKGNPVYPIMKTAVGQYFPMSISTAIKMEVVEDKDSVNWAIDELMENERRYMPKEDFWKTAIMYGAPIAFLVSTIFFWIYFGGKLELMTNSLSGAATQLALAMEKFASAPSPPPIG